MLSKMDEERELLNKRQLLMLNGTYLNIWGSNLSMFGSNGFDLILLNVLRPLFCALTLGLVAMEGSGICDQILIQL